MTPLEIAAACCLAAAFVFGVFARAFAAFSRAGLEVLVEKARAPEEEGRQDRTARDERDFAQTASLARNFTGMAFAVLVVLATTGEAGVDWRRAARWFVGWAFAAELLPRALGTSLAEPIVAWLGGLGRWMLLPLWPVGRIVSLGAIALDRLRGRPQPDTEEEIEDEIRAIVAEGTTGGVLERGEGEMIESVLRLGDADVAEIMTPRTDMVSVSASATLEEAIKVATDSGHSRLPVYEENRDDIVGMLYVKDLLRHWGKSPPPALKDVIRKPHFIPESRNVTGLLEEMQRANVHIAIVLDEYGGTSGLVTVEDIVEEVVGEIKDEYDRRREPTWTAKGEGEVESDARVHVDDINKALGVDLPEAEDYDTVGGLVISLIGRIPRPGEKVRSAGVEFEVTDADARRVKRLRIARVAEEE